MRNMLKIIFISLSSPTMCVFWSITRYMFFINSTSVISLIKNTRGHMFKSTGTQIHHRLAGCFSWIIFHFHPTSNRRVCKCAFQYMLAPYAVCICH